MNERRANFLLGKINTCLDDKIRTEADVREQQAYEYTAQQQRVAGQKRLAELSMTEKRDHQALLSQREENRDNSIAARIARQKQLLDKSGRSERKNEEVEYQQNRSRQRYMERQRQRAYS